MIDMSVKKPRQIKKEFKWLIVKLICQSNLQEFFLWNFPTTWWHSRKSYFQLYHVVFIFLGYIFLDIGDFAIIIFFFFSEFCYNRI